MIAIKNNRFQKPSINSSVETKFVSIRNLIIYPVLVFLDVLLTYWGTPDLKFEGNPIIIYLNLKWPGIIIGASFAVLLTIGLVIWINGFNYQKRINNKTLIWALLTWFYAHFSYSIFVIANNYLSIVQLHKTNEHFLYEIAVSYVNFYNQHLPYWVIVSFITGAFVGFVWATIRIKKVFFV